MPMPSYQELKEEVYNSPGCSYALKDALKAADKRDIVDAVSDAKTLLFILTTKMRECGIV